MLFSSLASFFALAAVANAHGYVDKITADGKSYVGPIPGETSPKSPIRRISTIDPYKDPKGDGITCGKGAKLASVVAPITAGSNLDLTWVAHPGQKWPHEMGPLITYMAKVPTGQTADTFDGVTGDFFKVAQEGQDGKGWFVARLMKLGTKYTVPIPKELEDGDYIMRHEIIALHLGDQKGGAEFYTSCFQLRVSGGTGTAQTTANQTARFPGAYTATDPGIYTPKVFDSGFKYKFPGPAIATFANSGSTTPGNSTEPTSTTSSEPADPTTTDVPDDDECSEEDPTTPEPAAPEPTETDDCTDDEDPESSASATSSSKAGKPTSNSHKGRRARTWMSRMEKRHKGAPLS